jgi:Cyclic nucleotide-binding domain
LGLEERRERGVLLEVRLERAQAVLGPVLERVVREVVGDEMEAIHARMIAPFEARGHGPFGLTSGEARPIRAGNVPPVSPRFAHEFARIPLLAELPGETLARLAAKMRREQVAAGASVVREGEDGDRFYVVLSGLLTVSQQALGARRVLRPGDYFGEVALAMEVPRTATVRALTPATLASCDRKTFDELIRPLFTD